MLPGIETNKKGGEGNIGQETETSRRCEEKATGRSGGILTKQYKRCSTFSKVKMRLDGF